MKCTFMMLESIGIPYLQMIIVMKIITPWKKNKNTWEFYYEKWSNLAMKIFQTESVNESECDTTNIIWYDAFNVMYS